MLKTNQEKNNTSSDVNDKEPIGNHLPLTVHFSITLPTIQDHRGPTARDSGGTTGGGGPSNEDANIDFD